MSWAADLQSVLDAFKIPGGITVTRTGAPALSSGLWVAPAPTSVAVADAVVYPASGKELERLPEGQRTRETLVVITRTRLYTAQTPAGGYADKFTHDGAAYEIATAENWADNGAFYFHLATKVPT